MERGIQTAQLLELSENTSTVCCLMRTGTADPEKGSIVSDQQKGANSWETGSHGYTSVRQPTSSFFKDRYEICNHNRHYIEKNKTAH